MMKTTGVALVIAFSALAMVACKTTNGSGSSGSGKPATGEQDVNTPTKESTSSDGGTEASKSSTSTSTTKTTDATASLTAYQTAICDYQKMCSPATYAAMYPTDDACIHPASKTGVTTVTYPGTITPTKTQWDACIAKIKANTSCAIAATDFKECYFGLGSLADGTACNVGNQCSGGDCVRDAVTDTCGQCAALKTKGQTCASPLDCVYGDFCQLAGDKKCHTRISDGSTCKPGDVCKPGFQCFGGKCQAPHEIGDSCTLTGQECRSGLTCKDGACAEPDLPQTADIGEDCGFDGTTLVMCKASSCVDGTCTAFAKEGEDCATGTDTSNPACDTGLTCQDGTCAKAPAPEVCK